MHPDDVGETSPQASLLAAVPDAVYRLDLAGRFTHVNAAAERLLERSAADLLGRPAVDCFPAARGSELEERFRQVLTGGQPQEFDYFWAPQQRRYEVRVFPDDGLVVFLRDVEQRRRAEQRLAAEFSELSAVLEALPSPTVLLGSDGRLCTANRAWTAGGERFRQLRGEPAGMGRDPSGGRFGDYFDLMVRALDPADLEVVRAGLRALFAAPLSSSTETFTHDYACSVAPGDARWFHLQACRVEDSERVVVTHTDITERVRGEQALAWQAAHDELTGLPNRAALLELLGAALQPQEDGGRPVALLYLDLDGFKTVNDSLGHEVGDALLCQVAGRLLEQIRPGDAVGRLGADQFLVLARDCDSSEAATLAFRLQTSFALPFPAGDAAGGGIDVPLSSSIGIAVARPGERDGHGLLSDADAAMYAAKAAGRDRIHLFAVELRDAARWRLEVATRLGKAAPDELVVHYQPVVRLDTGAVAGVEALVRWQHPERGLLPPDAFLSVAEETGQLIEITRWLLRETTMRAAGWARQGVKLRLSVNISARHFSTETLVHDVRLALRESGLPARQLILELTETSLAEDPARAEDQLTVLRGLGVQVAIDDFGTGWSSLAQLLALPVGTLKIDRSLLTAAEQAAAGDRSDVLAAIVALSRTLGIRSVAEGVETVEQLRLVRGAGCDYAQGWLLGQPMPAEELAGWVRRVRARGGDRCALALETQAG